MITEVPTWKKVIGSLAFVAQYLLVFMAVCCLILYQMAHEVPNVYNALLASKFMLIVVLLEFPLVLLRWALKWNIAWGTFSVLAIQLAYASWIRVAFHGYFEETNLRDFFFALMILAGVSALYFLYRDGKHTWAVWKIRKSRSR